MTSVAEFAVEDLGSSVISEQRDSLNRLLGARDAEIARLKRELAEAQSLRADAIEYRRLGENREILGEWLIDHATNASGRLIKPRIDAALGGEDFNPGSFEATANGRKYRIALVSTEYEIEEVI
jgi:hypothetical protein